MLRQARESSHEHSDIHLLFLDLQNDLSFDMTCFAGKECLLYPVQGERAVDVNFHFSSGNDLGKVVQARGRNVGHLSEGRDPVLRGQRRVRLSCRRNNGAALFENSE